MPAVRFLFERFASARETLFASARPSSITFRTDRNEQRASQRFNRSGATWYRYLCDWKKFTRTHTSKHTTQRIQCMSVCTMWRDNTNVFRPVVCQNGASVDVLYNGHTSSFERNPSPERATNECVRECVHGSGVSWKTFLQIAHFQPRIRSTALNYAAQLAPQT